MENENKHLVKEPDIEYGRYTYADYLTWEMDVMVELIKGKVFKRDAAAPRMSHQKVSVNLTAIFHSFLK
jgi:hypothetical protein